MAGDGVIRITTDASQGISELQRVERTLNNVSKEVKTTQASFIGMEVAIERSAKSLSSQERTLERQKTALREMRNEFRTMSSSMTSLASAVEAAVSRYSKLESAQSRIVNQATKMNLAQTQLSQSLARTVAEMAKADTATAKAAAAQARFNSEALRAVQRSSELGAALKARVTELEKQVKVLEKLATTQNQANTAQERSQPVMRNTTSSTNSLTSAFDRLRFAVINFIAAYAGIQTLKSISNIAIQLDSLNRAYAATQGSLMGGAAEMTYVRAEADRLGLSYMALAESYKGFSAATKYANISLGESREIFTSVSEAATVLGLSGEKTKLVLMALEQMVSKGVVSMEELRRQLGDSLPGAFELAAKAMGMGLQEFNKLVASGQLMTDEFLPKFARTLREVFGPGLEEALKSPRAAIERLHNQFIQMAEEIGKAGFLEGLKQASDEFTTYFKTDEAREQIYLLGKALGEIVGNVATATKWILEHKGVVLALVVAYKSAALAMRTIAVAATASTAAINPFAAALRLAVGAVAGMVAFQTITAAMEGVGDSLTEGEKAAVKYGKTLQELERQIDNYIKIQEYLRKGKAASAEEAQKLIGAEKEYADVVEKIAKIQKEQVDVTVGLEKGTQKLKGAVEAAGDEWEDFQANLSVVKTTFQELDPNISALISKITDWKASFSPKGNVEEMGKVYQSLNDEVKDAVKSGKLGENAAQWRVFETLWESIALRGLDVVAAIQAIQAVMNKGVAQSAFMKDLTAAAALAEKVIAKTTTGKVEKGASEKQTLDNYAMYLKGILNESPGNEGGLQEYADKYTSGNLAQALTHAQNMLVRTQKAAVDLDGKMTTLLTGPRETGLRTDLNAGAKAVENLALAANRAEGDTRELQLQLESMQSAVSGQKLASEYRRIEAETEKLANTINERYDQEYKKYMQLNDAKKAASKEDVKRLTQERDNQLQIIKMIEERKKQIASLKQQLEDLGHVQSLKSLIGDKKGEYETLVKMLEIQKQISESEEHRALLSEQIAQATARASMDMEKLIEIGIKQLQGETWDRAVKFFEKTIPDALGSISDGMATVITDIIMGAKSAEEAWNDFGKAMKNMFASLLQEWLQVQMRMLMFGSGNGSTGLLGGLVGGIGSMISSSTSPSAVGVGSGSSSSSDGFLNYVGSAKTLWEWGSKGWEYASANWFGASTTVAANLDKAAYLTDISNRTMLAAIEGGASYAEAQAIGASAASQAAQDISAASSTLSTTAASAATFLGFAAAIATVATALGSEDRYKGVSASVGMGLGATAGALVGSSISAASAASGAAAGATVGAASTSWAGPLAAVGAAIGALLGSLIGGGAPGLPAVRTYGAISLVDSQAFPEGSAASLWQEINQGKAVYSKDAGYYSIQTRANKEDRGLWEGAEYMFGILDEFSQTIVQATSDMAMVLPESIKQQFLQSEALNEEIYFGTAFKGKNITEEKLAAFLEGIQGQVERQWVAAFQSIDFSNWEYSGRAIVNQGFLEETPGAQAVKYLEGLQGMDVLDAIVNNTDIREGVKAIFESATAGKDYEYFWAHRQQGQFEDSFDFLINETARLLDIWQHGAVPTTDEFGEKVYTYTIDENGERVTSSLVKALSKLENLSGLEVLANLGYLDEDESGLGDLSLEKLYEPLTGFYDSLFEAGKEGLDKLLRGLSGMATIEGIIEAIENPVEAVSEWVTNAQAAMETLETHKQELLVDTIWTDDEINSTMEKYRAAVTQSFIDQINDIRNPLSQLQASVKEQMSIIKGWVDALHVLGATEQQIMEIAKIQEDLQLGILHEMQLMINPVSELDSALSQVNATFDDMIAALVIAEASIEKINEAEAARAIVLHRTAQTMKDSFYDSMRLQAMEITGADTTWESLLQTQRKDRIEVSKQFGTDSEEYALLLMIQEAQRLSTEYQLAQQSFAELNQASISLSSAAANAAANVKSTYQALLDGIRDALESAKNGIKQTIDAWVNATKQDYTNAANAYLSALNSDLTTYKNILDKMNSLQSSIWTDSTLNQQPTVYSSSRYELETAYAKAMSGDKDAIDDFASIAKTFLSSSMGTQGEYSAYQDDFYMVQDMINSLRGNSEQQVTDIQTEIDLIQQQLDVQTTTNQTLAELKAAMEVAYAEYQRALTEQSDAYAKWGFETVTDLEQQYRDAVQEWMDVQAVMNQLLLEGLVTESQLSTLTVVQKLEELKAAYLSAVSEAASKQAEAAAAAAAAAAAKIVADAAEAKKTEAERIAEQALEKANENKALDPGLHNGVYGSNYKTESQLVQAKVDAMNTYQYNTQEHKDFLAGKGVEKWDAGLMIEYMLSIAGMTVKDWYLNYGKYEHFANGGLASGLSLVGERGPELLDLQTPGRVYSNEELSMALSPSVATSRGAIGYLIEMINVLGESHNRLSEMVFHLRSMDKDLGDIRDMKEQEVAEEETAVYNRNLSTYVYNNA